MSDSKAHDNGPRPTPWEVVRERLREWVAGLVPQPEPELIPIPIRRRPSSR